MNNRGKPVVIQRTHYIIDEWDGTRSVVKVRSIGGRVVRRCMDGSSDLVVGGDVLLMYQDGVTHQETQEYFWAHNPEVAAYAPPGPNW